MSINLYKRASGIYHLRGTVQGIKIDQSSRTRSRSEAEAIRTKISADLFKRAIWGSKAVATFDDGVISYIEGGGSPDHLEPLLEKLGGVRLVDITQARVERLASEMKPNASAATLIRQVYTPVSAVVNHAARSGMCDPLRLKRPKVKVGRPDWLTPAQAQDWIEAVPSHLTGLITFYLATGCRASEALSLAWRDVSPGGERATFWETKGGYARAVDICGRAKAVFPKPDADDAGAIFRNKTGVAWHSYDAINLTLRKVKLKRDREIAAGKSLTRLVPVHCHMFRHTWATWAYAVTRDLTFLMNSGGWRSATMVMRYTHAASPELGRDVMKAGWEFGGRELPFLKESPVKAVA